MYTIKTDLQRSPINYSDEFTKLNSLLLKNTPLTTSGDATYTSLSSGEVYPATTGGESQLVSLLQAAIIKSLFNADDYNSIIRQIEFVKKSKLFGGYL